MPKASVIVPVYNAESTLRRCVESLLFGRERDIEVILVEDHSQDGSWELCRSLEAEYKNVIALRGSQNGGVSRARNRGLEAARGEYVLFCDSDDWVSGEYAAQMLALARQATDALPVCGFHYLDLTNHTRQDYVWCRGDETTARIPVEEAFSVMEKVLLQQLWTKCFRLDVIREKGVRFDESQNLGEDFQFVLDYLRAGNIRAFQILDRALYYYIRTGSSLMGRFGLVERENEYVRLETLGQLTGATVACARALEELKKNHVYHLLRSSLPSQEKQAVARELLGVAAADFCRQQKRVILKEKLRRLLHCCRTIPGRITGKLWQIRNRVRSRQLKKAFAGKNVSILSQNCIGGVLYHDLGWEFTSPTVDLYLDGGDFVRLAAEPEKYLAITPQMRWDEEYPVGTLGDVQVRFMHYHSCSEAKAAWLRRASRVQPQRLLCLCTDMESFTPEVFTQWKDLPGPKLLFTADPAYRDPDSLVFARYRQQGKVPDLIPRREFYKTGALIRLLRNMGE